MLNPTTGEKLTAEQAFDRYYAMGATRTIPKLASDLALEGFEFHEATLPRWAQQFSWTNKVIAKAALDRIDLEAPDPVAECLARMRMVLRSIHDSTDAAAALDAMSLTVEAIVTLIGREVAKIKATTVSDLQRLADLAATLARAQADSRAVMTAVESRIKLPAVITRTTPATPRPKGSLSDAVDGAQAGEMMDGVIVDVPASPQEELSGMAATQAAPQLAGLLKTLTQGGAKPQTAG